MRRRYGVVAIRAAVALSPSGRYGLRLGYVLDFVCAHTPRLFGCELFSSLGLRIDSSRRNFSNKNAQKFELLGVVKPSALCVHIAAPHSSVRFKEIGGALSAPIESPPLSLPPPPPNWHSKLKPTPCLSMMKRVTEFALHAEKAIAGDSIEAFAVEFRAIRSPESLTMSR